MCVCSAWPATWCRLSCSSARSASSRPCSTCCAPCPSPTPSSCWPSVVVTGCDTGSKSARASCRETEPSRLRLRPRRIFWRQDRPRSKFCRPKPRLKFWPLDRAETFSLSEPRLRPRKKLSDRDRVGFNSGLWSWLDAIWARRPAGRPHGPVGCQRVAVSRTAACRRQLPRLRPVCRLLNGMRLSISSLN